MNQRNAVIFERALTMDEVFAVCKRRKRCELGEYTRMCHTAKSITFFHSTKTYLILKLSK